MRKLCAMILAIFTICTLAACNNNPEPTEPQKPTVPSYEDAYEYTLVFTNDGMSIDLDWDVLSKVIAGKHKDATMMNEAITKNKEYYSNLVQLSIGVYNYEDLEATGVKTTISTEISLLQDKDITVCTQKQENSSYIGDKYPAERLHQMQRLGFEKYGIQLTGVYKIGYGDVSSEYTFRLQGRVKFEDKTDKTKLPAGKLVLTDSGAELTMKYADLLSSGNLTPEELEDESFSIMSPLFYTSKHDMSVGTMDIMSYTFTKETRPEELFVKIKYDRAWSNNQALYAEYTTVGQEMYVELPVLLSNGENEYAYTCYLRVDVESQLSEVEPTDANPMTKTNWTTEYVKLDDVIPFIVYKPGDDVGYTANTPMIMWLHGSGECLASEELYMQRGLPAVLKDWELNDFNAYIVCPIAQGSTWAEPGYVDDIQAIIDYMVEQYPVNPENISLAGHSLGGIGAQYFGGKMPETFARIAVLSGYRCDQLDNIIVPVKGWVGGPSGDPDSYAYMTQESILEKMPTTVLNVSHGFVPTATFTIDENQDGFSDVFMWLCGVE